MIYLCYSAAHQATYALANGVLFRFPDSARGHNFLSVLCADAIMLTRDERCLAHHAPIGRSLNWTMKAQLTRSRECCLHHFGTVVNDEAAV